MTRQYTATDFPHGLRCAECSVLFVEGQPIAERLDAMDEWQNGEPLFWATLMCVACDLKETM